MAQVSLNIDGEIEVSPVEEDGCLSVHLTAWLEEARENLYCRDWVTFHGSVQNMREFAQKILSALPAETAPVQNEAPAQAEVAQVAEEVAAQ
jgi:hypothetical protein